MAATKQHQLKVTVTKINPALNGNIVLMLFTEQGFPKKHQLAKHSISLPANQTELTFTLATDLTEFVLKVLHDENEDGKVSKNWTGIIPAEGLGFSNKQTLSFTGPPSYKKSKVSINPTQSISEFQIEIKYP
ncbi:DUF2141 domain-containing protein [Saccharobesus litoralis]|nr:DUF2141 domain-containing protein [Saccharobesus litoralis]